MANFKLVGAVAIKVRPDASGFRKSAQKQIKKELAGYNEEVKLTAKVKADVTELKTDVEKAEKEIEAKQLTLKVGLDYDSVKAAEKQLDAAVKGMDAQKVKVTLDPEGIEKARAELEEMKDQADIEMSFVPDEKGFKAVLAKIAEIRRQKLEQQIHFGWSEEELAEKEAEMKAALDDALVMEIHYGNDRNSIEKMISQVNGELAKIKEIKFDTKLDEESLRTTKEILENELRRTPVEVRVNYKDQASLKAARDRLKAMLSEVGAKTLKVSFDEASLKKEIDRINSMIDEDLIKAGHDATVLKLSYNTDKTSLEKAIAEIDAALAKIDAVNIEVDLNPAQLMAKRAELKAALTKVTTKIEYDPNLAGLRSAKAKIEEMLGVGKLNIETKLDKASLEAALAKVDADIKQAEQNELRIKTRLSAADYLKTFTLIKLLTKDQTVNIFTKMNNTGLLAAAAKLTGLRAATRWTEGFARSLGSLDRNLPIVAAAVVGLSSLASGAATLAANMFSLGNGLGEVVRMGSLLAPSMILGLSSVMIVLKAVFKDFGAAAHGIAAAMKRLPPAGQEAAKIFQKVFADIRESLSEAFWDKASDGMLRFSKTALPAFGAGLTKLSGSLGGIFSNILDSFTRLTQQGGIKLFFDNMSHGLDVAQTGLAKFMDSFNTLAVVGSTVFPRMGRAFNDFAIKFDSWVQRLAVDGTLNRWIDIGVQGMKDLFNSAMSLTRIWGNVGQAAQAAGAVTLHSFSQMMNRLDVITSGNRFQQNLKTIFQGARQASDSFHKSLGSLAPAMDVFSVTVKNTLAGAGKALGSFVALIGDVISSPRIDTGLTAFLGGVNDMLVTLRPAAGDVAKILQTFGEILGQVARDSGPLFLNLFHQLANVLDVAWVSLEEFLPGLIQIGTTIVNILGPALTMAARVIIPAFASALQQIGDGLIPTIQLLALFAVQAANLVAALPVPVVMGIAGGLLALGGAFKIAAVAAPIAGAAMVAFGVEASVAAARVQLLIPGIGILLAAATAIGAGAIGAFATSQRSATPYANEYADALREDAKAAGAVGDAIGKATVQVALKKLMDSGAYDAAKKLGIGTNQVTDAVLDGGAAWEAIQKRVQDAQGAYEDQKNTILATGGEVGVMTDRLREQKDAADVLSGSMEQNRDSITRAQESNRLYAEVAKQAGINTEEETTSQKGLAAQAGKTSQALGAAAAASAVLQDAMSSSASKVDAMRKTFEILLPPNAKQKAAEQLGAYAKGFNDIRDAVVPLAQDMKNLGDKAYGEKGFLNVASGNKAVMQVNQGLVDEVNNVWAGAKAAYDAAITAGKDAETAFQSSKNFISEHKGDYDKLAQDSGLASEKVQGQWDAVFGHDWVLKVSLAGATEAAATAQALVAAIKGNFDGQDFQAYLDANPDKALKAVTDARGAAQDYVNHTWQAKLTALPDAAEQTIREAVGMTEEEWNEGDFAAVLEVAKGVPGLAEALMEIRNGVGVPFYASIFASLNNASERAVQIALNSLTMPRTVAIRVAYDNTGGGNSFVPRGGQRAITSANGNILDGFGRQVKHFANGGIERHVAQITKPGGPIRVWSERETQGEAYVPYAMSKRPRSVAILSQVAKDFGYNLTRGDQFANGGMVGTGSAPSTHNTASVHIGTLNTTDADAAVRKIRMSQLDALAVAGISLNGV